MNEKFAPELLESKSEIVECVMEQLDHMVRVAYVGITKEEILRRVCQHRERLKSDMKSIFVWPSLVGFFNLELVTCVYKKCAFL